MKRNEYGHLIISWGDIFVGITIFAIFFLLLFSIVTIPAGHRGVLLEFGKVTDTTFNEGLHFKAPFVQSVKVLDVRTGKIETTASAASKDLQIVTGTIALNYRLNPEAVNWLYKSIGIDFQFKVIDPAIQESVKAATSQFTAEQLITQREIVREHIKLNLREKIFNLTNNAVIIEDLNIVNFDFSPEFNAAIESKVTAEQQALKAERDLDRIKIEAQQKIEVAKAEAESLRIQNEAMKESQDILKLRWVEKWNGILPNTLVIGEESNLLLGLNK